MNPPFMLALAFAMAEAGLQLSGYQNPILAWAFGILAVLFGIYAAWPYIQKIPRLRITLESRGSVKNNPLQILFSSQSFEEAYEPRQGKGFALGTDRARRRTFWIEVYNSGSTDISNVCVDITKIAQAHPHTIEDKIEAKLGTNRHRLKFKNNGYQADFPPKRRERLDVVSHSSEFFDKQHFRVEGDGYEVYNPYNEYRLEIEVTAKEMPPVNAAFFVSVDPHGEFNMVAAET